VSHANSFQNPFYVQLISEQYRREQAKLPTAAELEASENRKCFEMQERDRNSFIVVAGMKRVPGVGGPPEFQLREAVGKRQAGHGGLFDLGDDVLMVVYEFMARGMQPQAVWKGHAKSVNSVSFSRDGVTILSGSTDAEGKLWRASSKELVNTLLGHSQAVSASCFVNDGTVITASKDKTLKLWSVGTEISTGSLQHTLGGHNHWVSSCCVSPDSTRIISGSYDQTLKVWDAVSGEMLESVFCPSIANCCSYSPDGSTFAAGYNNGRIFVHDAQNFQMLHESRTLEHGGAVLDCCFSPDSRKLLSASKDKSLQLWGLKLKTFCVLLGHTSAVRACCFGPDGQIIVSVSNDKSMMVWERDEEGWKITRILRDQIARPMSCAFAPDGKTFVSGHKDGTLAFWEGSCCISSTPFPPPHPCGS
jgi:WD40 repeat protein